jgi:hypothetical protein
MSAAEKLDAMRSWKRLSALIREAKAKRNIPRIPLETMPSELIDGWIPNVAGAFRTQPVVSGGLASPIGLAL